MSARHAAGTARRILFVHEGGEWIRGSERCVLDLAILMKEQGAHPVIAASSQAMHEAAGELAVSFVRTVGTPQDRVLPRLAGVRTWQALVRQVQPDVVHANSSLMVKELVPACWLERRPLVFHCHIPSDREERHLSFVHQATFIAAISRQSFTEFGDDGYPLSRLMRISNGVRVPLAKPTRSTYINQLLNIPRSGTIAISVGSLIDRKGHDRVCRAFEIAAGEVAGLHLVIVGDGAEEERLRQFAAASSHAHRVHFLGVRSDVQALLTGADFLVSGARHEVQPLNVLEGFAAGLPVVASDIEPHRELIEHQSCGLLGDADRPEEFAALIVRCASDSQFRDAASERAYAEARRKYSMQRWADEFSALYDQAIEVRRRSLNILLGPRWVPGYASIIRQAARKRLRRVVGRLEVS